MLPILSLVMVVRDEAPHVEDTIKSIISAVDEFVWLDTGSSDETPDICAKYGRGARLAVDFHQMDFGAAKTIVSAMARGELILLLDADERLTGFESLASIVEQLQLSRYEAFSFPRRRWADLAMTQQVEIEAYPDWQARLYRNDPAKVRWTGILHEKLSGEDLKIGDAATVENDKRNHPDSKYAVVENGPIIEHFQDPLHLSDPVRAARRWEQRKILAARAGVHIEGSTEAMRLATLNVSGEVMEVSTEIGRAIPHA